MEIGTNSRGNGFPGALSWGATPPKNESERGSALRLLALLIIPVAIIAYYVIFSYAIYMGGLALLAALGFVLSLRTGMAFRAAIPLLMWYCWLCITALSSPHEEAVFYAAVSGVFVSYALIAQSLKIQLGDLFPLQLITLCSLAFSICALYSYYEVGSFIDEEKGSVRSLFAAVFIAAMPASLYLMLRHKSVIAAMTFLLALIIGSQLGSRTFFLLALPAIFVTAMVVVPQSKFLQAARYPLLFLVVVAVVAVLIEGAASSGSSWFEELGQRTSFQIDQAIFWEIHSPVESAADLDRRLLVVVGLDSFFASPLTGAGFMSTPFYMGGYRNELTAHGFPLFLLGELGLIGTALFIWAVAMSVRGYFRDAKHLPREETTVAYVELISLAVIFANGMFHQVYSDFYFYLFLGIGFWRLSRSRRRGSVTHVKQTFTGSFAPSSRTGSAGAN